MESKTIDKYGYKEWRLPNGLLHREDEPAIEHSNGNKYWYINGSLHREDGPAVEYASGAKRWCLNGKQYTENEYKYEMRSRKLKKLLWNLN
jgi:hypothetical protein